MNIFLWIKKIDSVATEKIILMENKPFIHEESVG